jgi:hypothetical protein
VAFPAVSSAASHRQQFRSESPLVDQDLQGYELPTCSAGVTDVSLPIFQVEVQKRRILMSDAKTERN